VLSENAGYADGSVDINIVDWEATSEAALQHLLDAAKQVAGNRQLVIWSATLSSEKLALLERSHFRAEPEAQGVSRCNTPHLLVRALSGGPASEWRFAGRRLTDLADWDVRMLYSMRG
jgi:hypothetical protein